MLIQELKLKLIEWILNIQNPEVLQSLWEWKENEKREREAKFLASYGAWQDAEDGDLMEDIYGSRYFEEREIEL